MNFLRKLGSLFVNADYLAQMAHFGWASMFCYAFTFWMSRTHYLSPREAVSIAAAAFMGIYATPKEWYFDPKYENAPFWDNMTDWLVLLAGCLSVATPVWIWAR